MLQPAFQFLDRRTVNPCLSRSHMSFSVSKLVWIWLSCLVNVFRPPKATPPHPHALSLLKNIPSSCWFWTDTHGEEERSHRDYSSLMLHLLPWIPNISFYYLCIYTFFGSSLSFISAPLPCSAKQTAVSLHLGSRFLPALALSLNLFMNLCVCVRVCNGWHVFFLCCCKMMMKPYGGWWCQGLQGGKTGGGAAQRPKWLLSSAARCEGQTDVRRCGEQTNELHTWWSERKKEEEREGEIKREVCGDCRDGEIKRERRGEERGERERVIRSDKKHDLSLFSQSSLHHNEDYIFSVCWTVSKSFFKNW